MSNRKARDYEKDWEDFWKEIVCNPDGTINMDQLKRELSDHLMMQDHLGKIICHVTADRVSKITTLPEVVCQVADDRINELCDEVRDETAREFGHKWVHGEGFVPLGPDDEDDGGGPVYLAGESSVG